MKFHKIDAQGPVLIEEVTKGAWQSSDERRIIYNDGDNSLWFADNTEWKKILTSSGGSLPVHTHEDSNEGGTLDTLEGDVGFGGNPGAAGVPTLRRCTINTATGAITTNDGEDLMLNSTDDASPDQQMISEKFWSAVWNDLADFQTISNNCINLTPGKCYKDTKNGLEICNEYCSKGVVGIYSDTFGLSVGVDNDKENKKIPIAISGWVLAYVDKEYETGDVLTNDNFGNLTLMKEEDKIKYPERIVGIYIKPENEIYFGTKSNKIKVNGRHWVKVK